MSSVISVVSLPRWSGWQLRFKRSLPDLRGAFARAADHWGRMARTLPLNAYLALGLLLAALFSPVLLATSPLTRGIFGLVSLLRQLVRMGYYCERDAQRRMGYLAVPEETAA